MDPEAIKKQLGLTPLPGEGGWFRETWRSTYPVSLPETQGFAKGLHQAGTAIYYFLGPGEKSILHRIPGDETYHFYVGGTVHLVLLEPGKDGKVIRLGNRLDQGEIPQFTVPGGAWQGSWVVGEPGWALLGTTVVPGFEFSEWEAADSAYLAKTFPQFASAIAHLS